MHELVVSGENIERFCELVGFSDAGKAARLEELLASHVRAMNSARFLATVETLSADGVEDVYDVTVSEVHAFDANGLYVSNCGEQPLPSYGCCDLGSIDLTALRACAIRERRRIRFRGLRPSGRRFGAHARQRARGHAVAAGSAAPGGDGQAPRGPRLHRPGRRARDAAPAVRHRRGARDGGAHRPVHARSRLRGLGRARARSAAPSRCSTPTSIFPGGNFASRLPQPLKDAIRRHGIRNSHLLSIAPTGTISLAFADNASNGIEPPFSWTYTRKKRMADGTHKEFRVEDHAWRLYRHLHGAAAPLPDYFVTALEISADAHQEMVAAVAPFIDTSISKTVNVPEDYPYADFEDLYMKAWKSGLKGLATYRPNDVLGAVLTADANPSAAPAEVPLAGANTPPGDPGTAAAGAHQPALAGTPRDARRQPRVDLHGRFAVRALRALRRARSRRPGARFRSRCGSTAQSSRAASARSPRRFRWTCAPTTARG